MKNEKKLYTSPSLEVMETEVDDVIATSGFNSPDHVLSGSRFKNINSDDLWEL